MNHITIELCQEDRQRIDELIAFAGLIAGEMKGRAPSSVSLTDNGITVNYDTPENAAPAEEHPVDAVSPHADPVAGPVAEPERPKYTKADVQAKVQKMAGPNSPKREQVKALVKSYGAKISDIPEDKYDEVMAKLAELEG